MRAYTNRYRAQATFGTPLGLGEYLALTTPFVLELATSRHAWKLRLAALASLPLLFFAVILTDSRLGMIGCLLSYLLYGMIAAGRLWKQKRSSLLGPAVSLGYPAIFCLAVAATFFVGKLRVKVWGGGAQQASSGARLAQYQMGIAKFVHNPFGYGIGMGAETLDFRPFGELTIDTYYISIALEYGLLGFILYFGMIAVATVSAGRRALGLKSSEMKDEPLFVPLTIAMINFLVIKTVFSQQDNHPIIYMMLGAIVALSSRTAPLSDVRGAIEVAGKKRRRDARISAVPQSAKPST